MAMNCLVKVILPTSTSLPEDDVVNDFVFEFPGGTPAAGDFDNLRDDLAAFYNTTPAGGVQNVGYYMSGTIARPANACSMRFYDIGDPPAEPFGSPVTTRTWTFTEAALAGGDDYPNEVAIVLSQQANVPPGNTHAGRYRGRTYIGPLAVRSSDLTSLIPRPSDDCRDDFCRAAHDLLNAVLADGWLWRIWSRADAALHTIVGGWVDDAYDTQRRRGVAATTRDLWSA